MTRMFNFNCEMCEKFSTSLTLVNDISKSTQLQLCLNCLQEYVQVKEFHANKNETL